MRESEGAPAGPNKGLEQDQEQRATLRNRAQEWIWANQWRGGGLQLVSPRMGSALSWDGTEITTSCTTWQVEKQVYFSFC